MKIIYTMDGRVGSVDKESTGFDNLSTIISIELIQKLINNGMLWHDKKPEPGRRNR